MPEVITPLPAVEGLGIDAKAVAGETSIATMRLVVVKPFKSLPGFLG
ncbi:hypothetical protein ES703_64672 [subsurface metagenome]